MGTLAAAKFTLPSWGAEPAPAGDQIMTVRGPISPAQLGVTLSHEHCVVDFLGAENGRIRHDSEEATDAILPHLKRLRDLGCESIIECTPAYIGRDVRLLKSLSEASRLNIVTNTGYYGAAGNKFIPKHALVETVDQLAARWLKEWQFGIDGTNIRPGFIKLGTEKGRLSDLHSKHVRAAARVHLQTGLTIAIHNGDGTAALDELRILEEERVSPSALVWVHAQNDPSRHLEVARRGAWVSLDGFNSSEKNRDRYRQFLIALREKELLDRVLLSHDHFWSVEGSGPRGTLKLANGGPKPYRALFTDLIPDLKKAGFAESEIRLLTVTNPAKAFTISRRT
jgi:predicted metal-dependent phosphotriesterase family hydrolase